MEKDDELKGVGNSYTTEFRQYDPRLGRWLSLDPLMMMFPNMSPYVAFNDNPVLFVDPLGLEGGPAKQQYPSHQESGHVLANGEVVPIPFSREYADEYAKKNNTVVLGMGSITVYELPEVETNPDHDIPDFVEENSAWGADAVDGEIARRGIESFAPQPPNIPESADQWEKDFANWNYKNNKEVWDKASLEEKWHSARQSLIIGGIREAGQEMVKPVAQLYTIQADLGGSGLASGGPITKVATAINTAEKVEKKVVEVVWNLGEAVITKKHHNWVKIFGSASITLDDVLPYVRKAIENGKFEVTGVLRGRKGVILGDKLEMVVEVEGHQIWVGGMKDTNGKIYINNAAVR